MDKLHLHFVGSAEECGTVAAGNTARTQTGGLRQREDLAIMGVKGFDFEGGTVGLRESRVTLPSVIVPSTSVSSTLI
jgi:hypothetical protein